MTNKQKLDTVTISVEGKPYKHPSTKVIYTVF
jgi:hypothetical protein